MPLRLLLLSLLCTLSLGRGTAQTDTAYAAFLERHYDGGERAFLEHVYQRINYPRLARENCGVGLLHVRLALNPDRGMATVNFLNPFGYGVEEDVTKVLIDLNAQWRGLGQSREVEFAIAYRLGDGDGGADGDLTVTAQGAATGYGCPTDDELLADLEARLAKGKTRSAERLWRELFRRGSRDPRFLGLAEEYPGTLSFEW